MPFAPGNNANPRGRPKGSKNKVQAEARDMILESLKQRGGIKYLNGLADKDFCPLLGKALPRNIELDASDRVIAVIERRFVASGEPKVIEIEAECRKEDPEKPR